MKLPFIQHIGIGLHITQHAIRWVELSRMRDMLRLKTVDVETVEDGDIRSGLMILSDRQNLSFPYVTVNIGSSHVKQQLIDVPDFDEQEYLEYWLEEQAGGLIPEGLKEEEFVIKTHFLGEGLDDQYCLFVIVRKQAIQDRVKLLNSVGLKPIIITTGHLQAGYGLVFDEAFSEGKASLISIFEDASSLQLYHKGMLENYIELSVSDASSAEVMEEATTYFLTEKGFKDGQKQDTYLLLSEHYQEKEPLSSPDSIIQKTQLAKPLSKFAGDGEGKLSVDHSIAAGMAVRQLYPAMDTINLLEEDQHSLEEEIQKKDALNAGILTGGSIILLYVLIVFIQFMLSSSLDNARQQVILMKDNINTVNVASDQVKELKRKVDHARKLVSERTSMAMKMEVIGRSLPGRVWFREVKISKSGTGEEVVLYGYAHNDALVASLMERLEKERTIENVRLIFSESIRSEDVYNDSSFKNRNLVQFEVRITIKSTTG